MKKTLLAALVALAPAMLASAAKADVLDFSYTWAPGDVISGAMDGTLLSNDNTFDVSSFGSLFVNGSAVPLPTLVESLDYNAGLIANSQAEVSLNGSYMDLYASSDTNILLFGVGDAYSAALLGNVAGATLGYGGTDYREAYDQSWAASIEGASTPVPEPSSLLLMLAPLALTALLVTSRRTGRRAV